MAEVRPFRGLRYNPASRRDLGGLLCPPYDEITPAAQDRLYERDPLNIVRLELNRPTGRDDEQDNPYTRAAAQLHEWLRDAVLVTEGAPAYYLSLEEHEHGGSLRTRQGLYAAVTLEEYGRGAVLPHEHTRKGPKEDRMRLMRACSANFSPILALYQDPGGLARLLEGLRDRPADYTASIEGGAQHRVWVLKDPRALREIGKALATTPLYLADGHHRYETALAYRDHRRGLAGASDGDAPFDRVLMCLTEVGDPGLGLQAFHRLLSGLGPEGADALRGQATGAFESEERPLDTVSEAALEGLLEEVVAAARTAPAFGLVEPREGRSSLLRLRDPSHLPALGEGEPPELQSCGPWLLHRAVLDPVLDQHAGRVDFIHDLDEVARWLADGRCEAAILAPPMSMEVFEALVLKGQRLPPKSTYFTPKLPTGLVMHTLG